ncbi:hypothetical protein H8356DRAFT_1416030 [Neocallimastix lanati (nom. inval.)]|nr:hypothetical protein H8356DRAFT_1416030 [Neocallimastix sp. JGI-2020a]
MHCSKPYGDTCQNDECSSKICIKSKKICNMQYEGPSDSEGAMVLKKFIKQPNNYKAAYRYMSKKSNASPPTFIEFFVIPFWRRHEPLSKFLFSDLLNHRRRRNNYTNLLIDQVLSIKRNTFHVMRTPTSFKGKNILEEKKSIHISSGGTLCMLVLSINYKDKN